MLRIDITWRTINQVLCNIHPERDIISFWNWRSAEVTIILHVFVGRKNKFFNKIIPRTLLFWGSNFFLRKEPVVVGLNSYKEYILKFDLIFALKKTVCDPLKWDNFTRLPSPSTWISIDAVSERSLLHLLKATERK